MIEAKDAYDRARINETAGQLPTWWRKRDKVAVETGRLAGRRMSDRTLRRLQFAIANGPPELRAALDSGRLSIAAAADLARLPADLLNTCLANARCRREALRIIRAERRAEP